MKEIDRRITIGAGAIAVLAAFLPWAFLRSSSFENSIRTGVECRDGLVTAMLGLIGVAVLRRRRPIPLGATVAGLAIVAISIVDMVYLDTRVAELDKYMDAPISANVGFGLYLNVVAGVLLLVAAARVSDQRRAMTPPLVRQRHHST